MEQALTVHRLHFAFTVTFHCLFPQLTMGLALLLVYLKTKYLRTGDEHYNRAARFWDRIFGINFAIGVVTGIPMASDAPFSEWKSPSILGQPNVQERKLDNPLEVPQMLSFLTYRKWNAHGHG